MWLIVAPSKYDIPPGIPPPPSHERTRRWEPGPSQSNSRSPIDLRSHLHSHPPSIREQDVRSERTPLRAVSHGQKSRRSTGTHSLNEGSRVHGSVTCSGSDDDGRPAALFRFHSPSRDNTKGKQRAPSRSLSPPPDSNILCGSPVTCRERSGSPGILTATANSSLFKDTSTEWTTGTADTPSDDVQSEEARAPLSQPPESSDPTRIPVASHQTPDGSTSTVHTTHATDNPTLPLEGLHSLNNGIIASPNHELETSEHLSINHSCVRTKPMRQPRYRSQRDSIIAYLQPSSTTPRRPSSTQPRPAPTLLARISDRPVVKLNPPPDGDTDITEKAGGIGRARLVSSPTPERSSGPSVDDGGPSSRKRKEASATKAGVYGPRLFFFHPLRNAGA
jgi:hypothetical protein